MRTRTARDSYLRVRLSARELQALEDVAKAETAKRGATVTVSDVSREGLETTIRRGFRIAREAKAGTST